MTTSRDLYGTWHLARWDITIDAVERGYPMGDDAHGQIIYSPDGHMSAILSVARRPSLSAITFQQAPVDERDAAALSYVSYGGTWELDDETVVHHVAYALFPNWIGTDLLRDITWCDGQLVLTGAPETTSSGKTVINRLAWHRALPRGETSKSGPTSTR